MDRKPTTVDHLGERDVFEFTSGQYAAYQPKVLQFEVDHARRMGRTHMEQTVQVAQWIEGRQGRPGFWSPTPARYFASTIAALIPGEARLSIDYGQGWSLDVADTADFIAYASGRLGTVPVPEAV